MQNPKQSEVQYLVNLLSKVINNPGDVKEHFGDQTSKTVYIGDLYNKEIVEHFKEKCTASIKTIVFQMDEFIEGITFIDQKGVSFPSTNGLMDI